MLNIDSQMVQTAATVVLAMIGLTIKLELAKLRTEIAKDRAILMEWCRNTFAERVRH